MLLEQTDGRGHVGRPPLLKEALLNGLHPTLQLFGLLLEALQPASLLQVALSGSRLTIHLGKAQKKKIVQ